MSNYAKSLNDIDARPVAVVGAGTLGRRIALMFSTRGGEVRIFDSTIILEYVEDRWPELFVQLDETQRRAVVQSLASAWHEGWTPNREDVENLTDEARGAIDAEEYRSRQSILTTHG